MARSTASKIGKMAARRSGAKKRATSTGVSRNGMPESSGATMTKKMLGAFQSEFEANPRNRIALNAVTKSSLHSVAQNRRSVTAANHTFSHVLKAGKATSQEKSGRCWMFAGLNQLRMAAINQMNLDDDFELSQNYVMFWDKLEKSNYFLEGILATLDEPVGSRLLDWLLQSPIQDGGQWDMFVNILNKYGALPKSAMPETESSGNTNIMNQLITRKLREYAATLRGKYAKGVTQAALRRQKTRMLSDVYRMLAIHLGEPPKKLLWQWRDKEGKFHRDGEVTPQEFLRVHIPYDFEANVCLIHCPQKSKSYKTLYTIEFLGNVVGGQIIKYLNVSMPVLKKAALDQIVGEEPVWFGCDVGKMLDRDLGTLDTDLYEYDAIYGVRFGSDKAERLDYAESQMNHAMVFTGVDLDTQSKPTKWRVENSWGDKGGDKGFLVMTDSWFDEYVYEVVVNRKYLPKELLPVLETEPTPLPPWDPMGALAR